ncbi:TIM-barrel domain-containing protein [Opitutus sp. GAS368]|uniref:TIM-barrel domain-containing protein n=1 Tax=Opitutus sp. GAS368 TaxID=1882749 RepID=UPI00087CA3FF|nr:TIM-barrel domain-containing protein [Opitutus sp. GAS368]SDS40169.1 alpha-glucosidase [Opitutus sp. GAS368]
MKISNLLPRSALALLAILAVPLCAETFAPRATGTAATLGDGLAFFLPADLPPARVPHSFALLEPARPGGALPAGWRVTPQFSFSENRTRATIAIETGTSLYGTGEVTGPLQRNGRTVTLWNTDNFRYEKNAGLRLYQSHPWVLAVRADGSAFGVLADTTWGTELSLNGSIEFSSDGPSFPILVIDRDSPQAVLGELARLTGHMPLPPLWALGYQQCRWSYQPAARVREIADSFRARQIPCDVLWMDIDYMDGFRVFTFSPKEFPDPRGLNAYLHEHGFKSVWMIDPGVKADPADATYTSGTAADVWVHGAFDAPYAGDVWPGECRFPDFTRPETRAWWAGLYKNFMAAGVDGVWNDMNEPAVFNVPGGTMPPHNWHRGGGDIAPGTHARYHNVYGMLMACASREGIMAANPGKRPFVLTRANFLGGQRYAATWTGDNMSTWEHFRMAIPMTLNLGLSGQPFNGPDLGGFTGTAEPELWGNWVAVGAFFPFCRAHAEKSTPPKEPWAFGPEVEAVARTALQRRYRLLPYYYTLFEESSRTGQPVMRPVFFADPKDPALRAEDRVFLVGDDLLVVPKWAAQPALPHGNWRTVSLVGENSTKDKYHPDLRIREGAIVPLGRVIQSTAETSLDPLTLLVSLDGQGRAAGRLYEDAGDGYGYQKGDFLLTTYRAVREGRTVTVTVDHTEGFRPRPSRPVVVQLVTDSGTIEATGRDGQPVTLTLTP